MKMIHDVLKIIINSTELRTVTLKMNSFSTTALFYLNCLGILLLQILGKTWAIENMENIVSSFVRKWLEHYLQVPFSVLSY